MLFSWLVLFAMPTQAQVCPKVLLSTNSFPQLEQGRPVDLGGIVLVQQFGGNLQIYNGTLNEYKCLIWESGKVELPSNQSRFYSTLKTNGTLDITRDRNGTTSLFYTTTNTSVNGTYYFIVGCDGVVGIYNSTTPSAATAVWQQRGNSCGLSTPTCKRTVLMRNNDYVQANRSVLQGDGAYISQENNGNVLVRQGTPSTPGGVLWQSCYKSPVTGSFVTILQPDSQLITRPTLNSPNWAWKRGSFTADTSQNWELALTCVGNAYGGISISDSTGTVVAWNRGLRPTCDAIPVCSTAILLLDTDRAINNGTVVATGRGYTLEQKPDGTLQLWKGDNPSGGCVVWRSTPSDINSVGAHTIMQSDGNLVTYGKRTNGQSRPVWNTQTAVPQQDSFTFVINNCGVKPMLAIYVKNPITDSDAMLQWSAELSNSCRRTLRGSDKTSKTDTETQGALRNIW
jgi:hypothetical protein